MKYFLPLATAWLILLVSCNYSIINTKQANASFSSLMEQYYNERMQLVPIESTYNGEPGNNDKLFADFTDSYREKLKDFFSRNLSAIQQFDREKLNENDKLSYDIFKKEMDVTLDGLAVGYFGNTVLYPDHKYMPIQQFGSVPLKLGQFGSGASSQPFKTIKDYNDWIKRATAFSGWADSAIVYFRKGINENIVLPEALVVKMIPQMEALVVSDPTKSLFYGPVNTFPDDFSIDDKKKLTGEYVKLINEQLVPSYKKLGEFLKNEYLAKARKSTGVAAMPAGNDQYKWLIRYWTTTDKTADEIYQTGLSEVKRIRVLMDSVRQTVGFTGNLKEFFAYLKTDKQFMPFKTPEEVLNAYRAVEARIEPNLKRMFSNVPKTKFEVRQTEDFRAASASAEYSPGNPDGSRPGIFYVPIIDATTFNVTTGIDGLFLHEAIPGHHYQISLQNENEKLPKFRRFAWYGAMGEGWALYTESLGKELGVYTDPYQYMGALVKEIHRSIRLVVDAGMHSKNMTREKAIEYMMDNMPLAERGTIAEIERYMAIPAQALSYKTGSLKIQELRSKYEKQLGSQFNLAAFHDELLVDGVMPLETLEKKMDVWVGNQKK
ncbi:MAG: DUF885 domain-containing protein [Chitinophagaceae bacterium]|nr:DUF885 domain-containing protein [Chitinophagaceae bacterium]